MTNYNPFIFYEFLKNKTRSKGLTTFFYPAGSANGISGLFPLEIPVAVYPASGVFVGSLTGRSLNLSWSVTPFADYYRVEAGETTTSGTFTGTYTTLAETENNYYTYRVTLSGANTARYVWWKITPIHQKLAGSSPLISYFSYKYVG